MNQANYDIEVMLPTIETILKEESAKTNNLSEKLVTLGEVSLGTAQNTKNIERSIEISNKQLSEFIADQKNVLETLQTLIDKQNSKEQLTLNLNGLKQEFAAKLQEIITLHKSDREAIVSKIAEVYQRYTDKVTELSNNIINLTNFLSDPAHQERITTLSTDIENLQKLIIEINQKQEKTAYEQSKRMSDLFSQLVDTKGVYKALLEDLTSNHTHVNRALGRMGMIETRLDALLPASSKDSLTGTHQSEKPTESVSNEAEGGNE